MRIFWRLFILLVIVTSLYFSWPSIISIFLPDQQTYNNQASGPPTGSKVILAYPLSSEQWIEFALTKNDQQLKLITNAELPLEYKAEVGERWQYAIEYELMNHLGETIQKGEINHKTGQLIFSDTQNKQSYVSAVYYPADVNPVDARLHLLNLRGITDANSIRIRLKSIIQPLVGLVARVYRQKMTSNNSSNSEWQRLSDDKKRSLSRASVYQKDLLRESEKQNLLSNQWSPIGPLGVKGEDYNSRKLYIMRDVEEDVIINLPLVPPNGLQVFPDIYGVIRVPVFSGKVKLNWQAVESIEETDQVNIEWWGHPSTRYQKWTKNAASGSFSEELESGVIKITSSKHLVFKVWIESEQQPVEITPKASYVRLYKSENNLVNYDVNHLDEENTPFKVSFRTFEDLGERLVTYRFFDKNNQIIQQGKLKVANQKSDYDRVNVPDARAISDPSSYYFNLPEKVRRVEFNSEQTVWVAAYTRPHNLTQINRYPYKIENATNQIKNPPVWYFIRPTKWKEYVAKGRSILLSIQARPPEIDPVLLEGQYKWENFLPQGNWRGRELLVAFDNGLSNSNKIANNKFKLILNTDKNNKQLEYRSEIEFKGDVGENIITPQLIFRQKKAGKLGIKLWLGETLHLERTVYSKDGIIILDPIEVGLHNIKIELDKHAEILLDQLAEVEKGFSKRTAIQLGKEPLVFNYLKQANEELLAFKIYSREEDNGAQHIRITVEGKEPRLFGPFNSWTIKKRDYILEAADGDVATVLHVKNNKLGPAKLIFIKLAEDMKNNENYQIRVEVLQGTDGYMIMTRTLPGVFETREIKKQKQL